MTNLELKDLINSGKIEIFEYSDFYKRNRNLCNYSKATFSISFPTDNGMELYQEWLRSIKSEFRRKIDTILISEIEKSHTISDVNYIGITPEEYINLLVGEIYRRRYKNVLVSSKIGSFIHEFRNFLPSVNPVKYVTSYKIGSISDTDIYIDSCLKWDDMRVFLLDDVFFNVEIVSSEIDYYNPFQPKLNLTFKYTHNIGKSEIIYLRDDERSEINPIVISHNRNKKINDILNGN